jgi:hypothetical protein
MKRKALRRSIAAGFVAFILTASLGFAAGGDRSAPTKAQPATRQQTARKAIVFKSDRTDSWLCTYVSPLFCSNLVPSLPASSNGSTASSSVPDRSRHD